MSYFHKLCIIEIIVETALGFNRFALPLLILIYDITTYNTILADLKKGGGELLIIVDNY